MPSMLDVEAAIPAYRAALGEGLDSQWGDVDTQLAAMAAALKAAAMVRAEESKLSREC
jgi:hypothetical protein